MSVEQLLADIRHDQEPIAHAASNLALVRIYLLTKALARLGCSCTQKTRETDIEAHEMFCQFRMAMQDMS